MVKKSICCKLYLPGLISDPFSKLSTALYVSLNPLSCLAPSDTNLRCIEYSLLIRSVLLEIPVQYLPCRVPPENKL